MGYDIFKKGGVQKTALVVGLQTFGYFLIFQITYEWYVIFCCQKCPLILIFNSKEI